MLDTSVLVAVDRGRATLASLLDENDDVAIAAITAAELLHGVARSSPRRREARSGFVEGLLEILQVVDYDLKIARAHAQLLAVTSERGDVRGAHDLMIAATAVASGRTVLTTDGRGFSDLPAVNVRVA